MTHEEALLEMATLEYAESTAVVDDARRRLVKAEGEHWHKTRALDDALRAVKAASKAKVE